MGMVWYWADLSAVNARGLTEPGMNVMFAQWGNHITSFSIDMDEFVYYVLNLILIVMSSSQYSRQRTLLMLK